MGIVLRVVFGALLLVMLLAVLVALGTIATAIEAGEGRIIKATRKAKPTDGPTKPETGK